MPNEMESVAEGFVVKSWEVTVPGYGSGRYIAKTRGKALADAWRCDAFCGSTFGEFIRHARCRRYPVDHPSFGDPITVGGKPAFYLDSNGQYVQFVYPGGDVVLNSHPFDVEPERYRPSAYRTAASLRARSSEGGGE